MARCRSALLITVLLTGCAMPRPARDEVIADRHWGLRLFRDVRVAPSAVEVATVRFRGDGGIDGTAICNSVSTGASWSSVAAGERGVVSSDARRPWVQTLVGCGEPREIAIADAFWKKMENARRWSLTERGLRIVFRDGSTAVLVPAPTPASERRPGCADPNNLDCRR